MFASATATDWPLLQIGHGYRLATSTDWRSVKEKIPLTTRYTPSERKKSFKKGLWRANHTLAAK